MSDEMTVKISQCLEMLLKIKAYNDSLAGNKKAQRWEEPVVPYLQSHPGTGKTSVVMQAADEARCGFVGFIGAQYDPAEMAGFIFFDQTQRVTWRAKPDFLPATGSHFVLCDEFAQMSMMQKNIMAQLIQERRLGEHRLSALATLVLAGNRASDRAGAQPDPTHVIDRVFILNVINDFDDWVIWALANGVRPEIVSYLKYRTTWFDKFDPAAKKNATPRGWTKVSTFLNMELPSEIELAAIQGQVGVGAASDFVGYLRVYRDLPDIDLVLATPKSISIPDPSKKPDVIYALCGALSFRANPANIAAIIEFCSRLPGEFEAMTIKDAIVRAPEIRKTTAMGKWIGTKGAKLFL